MPLRERTVLMSIARSFLCGGTPRAARPLVGVILLALTGAALLPAADAATRRLTVTTNADSGAGSLRAAVTQANADTNDTITFGAGVVSPIKLTSGELLLTGGVTITGPRAGGMTISGNNASRVFHVTGGRVTISSLTISGGSAGSAQGQSGGGLLIDGSTAASLTLTGCTLTGNTAPAGGGLSVAANTTATLTNDTISGNTASAGNGGGVDSAGTLSLTSVTVASNTASGGAGGGIASEAGGTATLQATLDATNTAGTSPDASGTFTSSDSNLIGDATGATGFIGAHDQLGTASAPIDPQLGPLANNGGPTQTRIIAAASPALNADYSANPPATDQRGIARPIGIRADVGAVEAPSPPATPTGLTATAGYERVTLTFTGTSDATGYNVYRGTTLGGEDLTTPINGPTPLSGTRYVDLNVTDGTTYYYVVEAVNGSGSSVPSNEAQATPADTRVRGSVLSWGDNTSGELGTGAFVRSFNPTPVTTPTGQSQPLLNVVQVAGGAGFSLALTSDGMVYAWGDDSYGQLGDGNYSSQGTVSRRATPAPVQSINGGALSGIVAISAGREFSLALAADGTVYAWGRNESGQLGNGTSDSSGSFNYFEAYANPVLLDSNGDSLVGAVSVAAGGFHSLAVMQDGSVMAWGSNSAGQLGVGTSGPGTDSLYPTSIPTLTGVASVAAGQYHSLALDGAGNVTAWGYDQDGELGDGGGSNQPTPLTVFLNGQPGSGATQIAAGQYHSLALLADGSVQSWGSDSNGQIGNGQTGGTGYLPTQIVAGGISAVSAGGAFSEALTALHTLDVFGANGSGQLGIGTTTDSPTPVNTLTAAGAIQPSLYGIAGGTTHALAIQNLPPVAVRQAYTVSQNGRTVPAMSGLLSGATDAENDGPLTVVPSASRATAHGTVTVRADGSFTYVPTAGYQGSDVFTYQVSDGLALSAPAAVTLTVTTLTLKSLAVNPLTASVAETGTVQFQALGTYNDGSQQDFSGAANWTSSDPTVASISNTGLATASAANPGTVTITATYSGLSAKATLTVVRTLKAITVTPANPNLDKGRTLPFTATASYTDNGPTTDVTQQVRWSTSNSQVVTISNSAGTKGVATGQGVSTAAIYATDPATGITGVTSISVTAAVLASITVTPANLTLARGGTRQYTATGVFSDGIAQDYTQAVNWATGNPNVATVDVSGVVTSVGVGSTQVTASASATDPATGRPITVVGQTGVTVTNPSVVPHKHVVFNLNGGQVALWDVDSEGFYNEHLYGPYFDAPTNPKAPWTITAVASALDGTQRLLWNNTDGRVALWRVDAGGSILSVTGYGPYTDGAAQNVWRAVAVSVGPDGTTHLLWDNTDGKVAFWDVDAGGNILSVNVYGPYTDGAASNLWSATAVATGPDGTSRILWNNPDGKVSLWTVDSQGGLIGLTGYGPYTDNGASNLWSATAVSVGTDGTTHLLWNNTDGKVAFWNVDINGGVALTGYGPFTGFTARAVSTDPQNVSHILWGRADGTISLWDVQTSDFSVNYHNYDPGAGYASVALSSGP